MKRTVSFILLIATLLTTCLFSSCSVGGNESEYVDKNDRLFTCGLLPVCLEESSVRPGLFPSKWAYVNEDGEMAFDTTYRKASPFAPCGLAVVTDQNNETYYINTKGERQEGFGYQPTEFDDYGYTSVQIDGKYAIMNHNGEFITDPIYDKVFPFTECGIARVKESGRFGYINTEGERIINPQFQEGTDFNEEGYAVVRKLSKYGILNKDGEIVIDIEYDSLGSMYDGIASFKKGDLRGYLNTDGETLFTFPNNSSVYRYNGYIVVDTYAFYSVYDTEGKLLFQGDYDELSIVNRSGYISARKDKTIYIMKPSGKVVSEFEYPEGVDDVDMILNHVDLLPYATTGKNRKEGFLDIHGKVAIKAQYDDVEEFNAYGIALFYSKTNRSYGLINTDGEVTLSPCISGVCTFYYGGYAVAKTDDGFILIDPEGKKTSDLTFKTYATRDGVFSEYPYI